MSVLKTEKFPLKNGLNAYREREVIQCDRLFVCTSEFLRNADCIIPDDDDDDDDDDDECSGTLGSTCHAGLFLCFSGIWAMQQPLE
ncbi:hypothetical protein TURU_146946 [Turdus rufiventris]|nr:hypothetical protein TURU_146946 [Turdus rufiventris]